MTGPLHREGPDLAGEPCLRRQVQELLHGQRLAVPATLMSDQLGRPFNHPIAFAAPSRRPAVLPALRLLCLKGD